MEIVWIRYPAVAGLAPLVIEAIGPEDARFQTVIGAFATASAAVDAAVQLGNAEPVDAASAREEFEDAVQKAFVSAVAAWPIIMEEVLPLLPELFPAPPCPE